MAGPTRSTYALERRRYAEAPQDPAASSLLRLLVVDDDSKIIGELENALWVWPHKLTRTGDVDEALRLCQHLTPSAVLVAVDRGKLHATKAILHLRRHLPSVPIIAIVSARQQAAPGRFLDQGADAVLLRDDACRPIVHEMISSVRRGDTDKALNGRESPDLLLPWKRSEIVGAMICDVTGLIVDANQCLVSALGYSSPDALIGRNLRRDLLGDSNSWTAWAQLAGDTLTMICEECHVESASGQLLWMRVEVFAAPNHPSYLQAVFIDQTELAMLTGGRA